MDSFGQVNILSWATSPVFYIIFSVIIVLVIPKMYAKKIPREKLVALLTMLGVFGTFLGVTASLFNFDVNNIKESLPLLLGGLKTAFITSLAGLIGAILVRIWPGLYGISVNEESKGLTEVQQMISLLQGIHASLGADRESSLLVQMRLLRQEQGERFTNLQRSFDAFAEKLVADSTQQLIDALNGVIKDFNQKISEQFGDNFKQLNQAVGRMLEWQQEYSARIERMTEQFERATEGLQSSQQSVSAIVERASVFEKSAEKLDQLLETMMLSLNSLEESAKKAPEVLPALEKSLQEMTEKLEQSVKNQLSSLKTQQERMQSAVEAVNTMNKEMVEEQRKAIGQQLSTLVQAHEQLKDKQQSLFSTFEKNQQQYAEQQTKRLDMQLQELDKQLEEELTKALSSLGSQLTSLSNQFVKDYQPLAEMLATMDKQLKSGGRFN